MDAIFSCDTMVVTGLATSDGSVILAMNSDRSPNECQPLTHVPRRVHRPGDTLQCQYRSIPQVAQTWECIGSRPYWLWGFEMGVNEWGVAIGNEAVLTREPYDDPGLIGMDLVRLGLERGATADEALSVMIALIEHYGQGGSCEATFYRTYHNSFIIADPATAWILETAGKRWVARRVRDGAAIGNVLTIGTEWDEASPDLMEHARAQGWVDGEPDFARAYTDPDADLRPRACRLDRSRHLLAEAPPGITLAWMIGLLRDHAGHDVPHGAEPLPTICMHANPAFRGETAAAVVAHLRPGAPRELRATVWTAFGSPCLSLFRPAYPLAVGLPEILDRGGARFDPESPWWVYERMQRLVARAPDLAPFVRHTLAHWQHVFFHEAETTEAEAARLLAQDSRETALSLLRTLVETTTEKPLAVARSLTEQLEPRSTQHALPELAAFWQTLNEEAGLFTHLGHG
ncbi:MAG: secernin-3 [Chloroflexota bacterium]